MTETQREPLVAIFLVAIVSILASLGSLAAP